MLGKVEAISGKLPQNAEGDVFGDEGDCDAGHKSNYVGGENRWYPAVVVAEKRRFITFACSNFSPEPAKEEHARHCADKEDGLKIEVLGLSLSLRVQPVRRRGSRIPRRPSRDRSLSTCALTC